MSFIKKRIKVIFGNKFLYSNGTIIKSNNGYHTILIDIHNQIIKKRRKDIVIIENIDKYNIKDMEIDAAKILMDIKYN